MKSTRSTALDVPGAPVFEAISHPVRRRILELLAGAERPVNVLAAEFEMSRPAVSQHLRVLLDAGLVRERRHGRERRYRLRAEPLIEVRDWVAHYERFWEDRLERLREHLAASDENAEPGGTPGIGPGGESSTTETRRDHD